MTNFQFSNCDFRFSNFIKATEIPPVDNRQSSIENSYVELHASSAFSFLESAADPEQLASEAVRLNYPALAMVDRDGLSGAPRFYRACNQAGIRAIVGAAVSLPEGPLPLLAKTPAGYRNLCRIISDMKLSAEKGEGTTTLEQIAPFTEGLVCLTGGATGPLATCLEKDPKKASSFLSRLVHIFDADHTYVELQRHLCRSEEKLNQQLIQLARQFSLPLLATNGVQQATCSQRPLLDVLTCIYHKTTIDTAGRLLQRNAESYLKSPAAMSQLFADLPEAVRNTRLLAERLDFTLTDLGYRFPDYPVPAGEDMNSYLRKLTLAGARQRYRPLTRRARRQIEHELQMIEKLELAGYFLIVWDIVQFCKRKNILVQGRGSAANSAVCYSLEITAVDPVGMDLLFERFLSEERGEWPDIDLDLPSGERREEVIQYVYRRYGRRGAAMTANVITYRPRSAAREVGKALGFAPDLLDRLSRLLITWGLSSLEEVDVFLQRFRESGLDLDRNRARRFVRLWKEIQNLPRHLGQHSGGMVLCQGRLDSIVPLEQARMADRTIIQWDKDDCAHLGIIKVDLLGLGMMSALQDSIQLIRRCGGQLDLAHLPQDDPRTYRMLQKADTVGVFQVESRAQMATLPRLKPSCFYDLVVEVAIIRPGPIVGDMVHPFLRRHSGQEPVSYPHPSLEPILKRTLGVPIFQEQLLKIAMVAAGFTGGQAEELRRALGFKRPDDAMRKIEAKLREGMRRNGITEEAEETIVRYITSFALYGFPESHAASFALLAYASAYIKAHWPAAFYASLLNNQPMGFYHPATLVKDAQHRGQRIRPIDVNRSDWLCTIENDLSVRLGLLYVRGFRQEKGEQLVAERQRRPFSSISELQQRVELNRRELTTLAEIGALNTLGGRRRQSLWQAEKAARYAGPLYASKDSCQEDSPLSEMNAVERLHSDYAGTGLTTGPHPLALIRKTLDREGILPAADLCRVRPGQKVKVAGAVIVRQRPASAKGFFFMSLEDETGISNIIVHPKVFEKNRLLVVSASFLCVEGILQNHKSVISLRATRFAKLDGLRVQIGSHDFG